MRCGESIGHSIRLTLFSSSWNDSVSPVSEAESFWKRPRPPGYKHCIIWQSWSIRGTAVMLYAKGQVKLKYGRIKKKKSIKKTLPGLQSFSETHLICPRTNGLFLVRFMLESKGTSKYCGKTIRKISQDTMIKTRHHTVMPNVSFYPINRGHTHHTTHWATLNTLTHTQIR